MENTHNLPRNLFAWDTDIGRFFAFATNVYEARVLIMGELPNDDCARDDLANAISVNPNLLPNQSFAALAWHH